MTRKRYSPENKVSILREHLGKIFRSLIYVKNIVFIPINYTAGKKSSLKMPLRSFPPKEEERKKIQQQWTWKIRSKNAMK
jgi:hypothetical protein